MVKYRITGLLEVSGRGENDDALLLNDYKIVEQQLDGTWEIFEEYEQDPLAEIFEDMFELRDVTIKYFLTQEPKTWDQVIGDHIKHVIGLVSAEYQDHYSEYTGYLWTDEKLLVGGHNLLKELWSKAQDPIFLMMEVDVK